MHRRESQPDRNVKLDGMFIPFYHNGQPVIVCVEGIYFIPVFSTVEKMEEQLPVIKPQGPVKTKQITNGREFLESVIPKLRVMLDPYIIDGNTRWTEVTLDDTQPQR